MSNFPFNNDKYKYTDEVNGSPLTFSEAISFADKILYWHVNENTSDFSQSSDGFDADANLLAFGLIELLSDPNAIKRIISTGENVKNSVRLLLDSHDIERWDKYKKMLEKIFEK
jgi:hypothetical protein